MVAERSEAEHQTTRGGGSLHALSSPAATSQTESHHPQTPSSEEEGAFSHAAPLTGGHAFTPLLIARFLEHLSRAGNVRAAAVAAGVSQQTAYVRRRRDPAFAAGWEAALLHARAAAEQVLAERAIMGTTETIWYRGEAVGQRQRFDARLLLAHLARLDARAAKASPAIHRLAEEFDDMLLALGEGEAPAQAAALPDPEREAYIEDCEGHALRRFHEENPEPGKDADDELWDLWGEVRDAMVAQARATAAAAWDGQTDARCARLEALFPGEVEEEEHSTLNQTGSPAKAGASGVLSKANSKTQPLPRAKDGWGGGLGPFTQAQKTNKAHRKTPEAPACAGEQAGKNGTEETPSAPCKPRKPAATLKCGTAAPALLASTLSWHQNPAFPAPHPLPATPLPLPQAPSPACPGAATGRSC
ncbi:hypothetical protein [Novosphingobium sp.]|uniref:hypothetical protein n=1 Tax=Novosphingobium sp. TaxID=1874826 RepID=UPI00262510AD|nr:hypothetical protein [Novosphingobium sp.]